MYGKDRELKEAFKLPETCGVSGCHNPCDIYIQSRDIARCTKHYTQDLSDHQKGGTPKIVGMFHAEKDIMDKLAEVGMQQTPDESLKEYALRCKNYLQTMDKGYGSLINKS